MRRLKYSPMAGLTYKRLTINKVYEVVNISKNVNKVELINDENEPEIFNIYLSDNYNDFIDVTAEFRDDIIDDILS